MSGYGPDLNPIEQLFTKLKAVLRKAAIERSRPSGQLSARFKTRNHPVAPVLPAVPSLPREPCAPGAPSAPGAPRWPRKPRGLRGLQFATIAFAVAPPSFTVRLSVQVGGR